MSIGTVADLIHSHSQSNQNSLHFQSSFALQLKCVGDVARGMLFLHSQDPLVIHRDLKPQVFPFNLLISIVLFMLFLAYFYRIYWSIDIGTQRYRGMIATFLIIALTRFFITVNQVGTPQYCAPEVLLGEKCRSIKNRFPLAINIFGS